MKKFLRGDLSFSFGKDAGATYPVDSVRRMTRGDVEGCRSLGIGAEHLWTRRRPVAAAWGSGGSSSSGSLRSRVEHLLAAASSSR